MGENSRASRFLQRSPAVGLMRDSAAAPRIRPMETVETQAVNRLWKSCYGTIENEIYDDSTVDGRLRHEYHYLLGTLSRGKKMEKWIENEMLKCNELLAIRQREALHLKKLTEQIDAKSSTISIPRRSIDELTQEDALRTLNIRWEELFFHHEFMFFDDDSSSRSSDNCAEDYSEFVARSKIFEVCLKSLDCLSEHLLSQRRELEASLCSVVDLERQQLRLNREIDSLRLCIHSTNCCSSES